MNHTMKNIIAATFLFFGAITPIRAQFQLNAKELKEDFRIFKRSIKDIHPGLYWYADSTEVESRFDEIERQLDGDLELRDFYTLTQKFYANMGCGHSWMSMPYKWRNYLDQKPFQIPFNIYFEQDRAFIQHDLTDQKELTEGAEILTLNGRDIMGIFTELLQYAPTDGFNETRRRSLIAGNFSRYYQTMIATDSILTIRLKINTKEERFTVKGITKELANLRFVERYESKPAKPEKLLTFRSDAESSAYIQIQTFEKDELRGQDEDFRKFLKSAFSEIRKTKTKNLILDLRGNGGGHENLGVLLCQYLIPQEFKYFNRMESVTKNFDYKEYSYNRSLNLLGFLVLKKDKNKQGFYTYNRAKGLRNQSPKKEVFDGELTVLIDGGTFSTSADVAAILHANKRARFVGEEAAGGYYGNNSAIMYGITLPHSRISYYLPIIRYYSAVDYPAFYGRGVLPDVQVSPTYEDVLNERDVVLEKAIELLR